MTDYQASLLKRLLSNRPVKLEINPDDSEIWRTDKTGSSVDIYRQPLQTKEMAMGIKGREN